MQNVCQTFLLLCWACLDIGTNPEICQTKSLLDRAIDCWSTGCGLCLVTGFDSGVEGLGCLARLLGIRNPGPDYTPLYPLGCCWGMNIYCSLTGADMRN